MNTHELEIYPIGVVREQDDGPFIEVFQEYAEGLLGLEGFSHIMVLYWFHENDSLGGRQILRVHPRGNMENPLTGVFATRSPVRPNLIALSRCQLLSIDGNILHIDKIDALNGSPVIDIKPYLQGHDGGIKGFRVPEWAKGDD